MTLENKERLAESLYYVTGYTICNLIEPRWSVFTTRYELNLCNSDQIFVFKSAVNINYLVFVNSQVFADHCLCDTAPAYCTKH